MKKCSKCGELKFLENFSKRRSSKDGLRCHCRPCVALKNKLWRWGNAKRKLALSWASQLKLRYGLSVEDFNQIRLNQQNKCAICVLEFNKTPCVDHDHLTGEIRGLLCLKCNSAIGFLGDSPLRLLAAAMYIQKALDRRS